MNENQKILYVDDEHLNLRLLQLAFKQKYDVLIALNGSEGMKILSENEDIHIVISDMKMPEMNGLEFVAKSKELFPCKNYFILTGFGTTQEIQEAINAGLVRYCFSKPFNMPELETELGKALVS